MVAWPRRLEIIFWGVLRQLSLFRPLPNVVVVAADVLGVEIDKGVWRVFARYCVPHLAEDADIDGAHQLLSNDVEAVSYTHSQLIF